MAFVTFYELTFFILMFGNRDLGKQSVLRKC